MKNAALIIIDPQIDFVSQTGALPVPGATKDMNNTARFLIKNVSDISCLAITADEHNIIHISHPDFWRDQDGNKPDPFTVIKLKDVQDGVWTPVRSNDYVVDYLENLHLNGETHTIWPVHCLANTVGATFSPDILEGKNLWEAKQIKSTLVVKKGNLWFTEQHSPFSFAFCQKLANVERFDIINKCDTVYFAGEAYSHCVKDTVVDCLKMGMPPEKIIVLKNCTSAIPGFDMTGFETKYGDIGVRFQETGDVA